VSEEENWERIDRFLAAIVPVATAAKVRLACHPHDPYTPPGYRGVTRVLGTVEGVKRFVQMHESPYHGLNFCQGTVAEMLDDPAREIFDVIRWFGERGKIFNVHFRNTGVIGYWITGAALLTACRRAMIEEIRAVTPARPEAPLRPSDRACRSPR
ncbi:MAG TPA: mannonate dehydratase, partial [Solirubrobacteraceae bacterium]|nr:mannonate dehydratase [Solirubrobacteraceae bacterium]